MINLTKNILQIIIRAGEFGLKFKEDIENAGYIPAFFYGRILWQ